jgi:hypothetical protein
MSKRSARGVFGNIISRLGNLFPHDPFEFIINGQTIRSSIPEAVSLSPLVAESLENDNSFCCLQLSDPEIELVHLSYLQQLVLGETIVLEKQCQHAMMKLCSHLHLVDLEKYFFNLWITTTQPTPARQAASLSDAALSDVRGDCASNFPLHSDDELSWLSHDSLASILSDKNIKVESEDWLLRQILSHDRDIGLLEHVQFAYLSADGLAYFAGEFSFVDLTEPIWLSILAGFETLCRSSSKSNPSPRSLKSSQARAPGPAGSAWGGASGFTAKPAGSFGAKPAGIVFGAAQPK